MILRWMLFETTAGQLLLLLLEKWAGLAVVEAGWLGEQEAPWPLAEAARPEGEPVEQPASLPACQQASITARQEGGRL